ncbi:RNA polymerase II mediator complex subunit [Komagataella phaffii CBS 7435]|uniref:Mediator of RNA polymerase II transcription subunit 16 n=2 Tax=Komagataella phaffii TaxID=460519 RepID=C4QW45_KOMPG|nr:Subunit of the RNA polymerase II mediator complex [Komagataella phaffii GS115]AOA60907.1 GQ67_02677T0 [Komagataella phaffii]CAH2446134.1 RNA polymerase II mediator complex subunit [Komagataella phaffii CBS 7435]AOA65943.1 GQ68_02571T0 [Komagataella phaffii GS115]CAY67468.1 Subunit of the RNA polymerase II mediator complex [Komagataella phaffii GS115]CCA36565.1 RNA polymerase II mediator complex subunit [Komagataella phaffii CBS 7435]
MTKISWSKNGFIAYTDVKSPFMLCMSYLECLDGRRWQMAPPIMIDVGASINQFHTNALSNNKVNGRSVSGLQIQKVTWNGTGTDLAIADSLGNISIFIAGVELTNSPNSSTPSFAMTLLTNMEIIYYDEQGVSQVNSLKWLNLNKPIIANVPAVKVETTKDTTVSSGCAARQGAFVEDANWNAYSYGVHQYKPYGTSHPIGAKHALFVVRDHGDITLYYQGEHGLAYYRCSAVLPECSYVNCSSIGFTRDGDIIVAVYSKLEKTIQVYRCTIDWGYLIDAAEQQKRNPSYTTPGEVKQSKLPSLSVELLQVEPVLEIDESGRLQTLKHMSIVSPNYNSNTELDFLIGYESTTNDDEEVSTKIYRYQMANDQKIHILSAFLKIGESDKQFQDSLPRDYSIRLKQVATYKGSILNIEFYNSDLFVVLTFTNGEIKVVNRINFKELLSPEQLVVDGAIKFPSTALMLNDAGFQFPKLDMEKDDIIETSFSPNLTSLVSLNRNTNQLHFYNMKRKLDCSLKGFMFITCVAMAFRYSYSCFTNTSCEDLFCCIHEEVARIAPHCDVDKLNLGIIQETHRSINFNIDFGREHVDKLLGSPPLQRLLSLQFSLSLYHGWKSSKSAAIANVILNIRTVGFALMYATRSMVMYANKVSKRGTMFATEDSKFQAESVVSCLGPIKWFMDFCVALTQQFIELDSQLKLKKSTSGDEFVAVPIVLGKIPRYFMMYCVSYIRRLYDFTKQSIEKIEPNATLYKIENNTLELSQVKPFTKPLLEVFYSLKSILEESPVSLEAIDKFLNHVDEELKTEYYTRFGTGETRSLGTEQSLVFSGEIPSIFLNSPSILEMLNNKYSKFLCDNLSDTYFYDTEWLRLEFVKKQLQNPSGPTVHCRTDLTRTEQTQENNHSIPNDNSRVDDLRKLVFPYEVNVKKCTRCCSVSQLHEPISFGVSPVSIWLMAFQRSCICGGYWVHRNGPSASE